MKAVTVNEHDCEKRRDTSPIRRIYACQSLQLVIAKCAYVLYARRLVEAEVLYLSAMAIVSQRNTHLVKTEADVVAVKTESMQLLGEKMLLKCGGDGRLQPCQH